MEFYACILGGAALVVCGLFMFRIRLPDWRSEAERSLGNRAGGWQAVFQRGLRYCNNGLLIVVGGGIFTAAFLPHGRGWMLLWTCILLLLLLCILMAMLDALTSMAGYRRALPEVARRTLGGEQDVL